MMKNNSKTFERELPGGYRLARHINAKDVKLGVVFNFIALAVWLVIEAIALIPLLAWGNLAFENAAAFVFVGFAFGAIPLLVYMVLHELVHGWAYKRRTGERLKFGISWSCAFCGVPNIYTYRATALFAVLLPFAVFTLILFR